MRDIISLKIPRHLRPFLYCGLRTLGLQCIFKGDVYSVTAFIREDIIHCTETFP